jgi:hypothetical protein
MRCTNPWLVFAALVLASRAASAQPRPPDTGAAHWQTLLASNAERPWIVRTTWTARNAAGRRTARVDLLHVDPTGHESLAANVYSGPPVRAVAAMREGAIAVVVYNGGDAGFVRATVIRTDAPGRAPVLHRLEASTVGTDGFRPARAVVCADETGFTVLWQDDPSTAAGSAARETRATLRRASIDGVWLEPSRRVEIPWSLGAIAWNGHGYHLAVRYDGSTQDQTRLCLVTLTASGVPEQHPWWASEPESIGEIALAPSTRGMWVAWRNDGAGRVEAALSTQPGSWGASPAAASVRGPIAADDAFAPNIASDGSLVIVRHVWDH